MELIWEVPSGGFLRLITLTDHTILLLIHMAFGWALKGCFHFFFQLRHDFEEEMKGKRYRVAPNRNSKDRNEVFLTRAHV